MGMILLYGILILLILVIVAIILLIRSLKRKSNGGIGCSILIFAFVIFILLGNTIDEMNLDKDDVRNDLKFLGVELIEEFEILDNDVTGMPERYQETELKVSKNDVAKLISRIINSKNFVDSSKGVINKNKFSGLESEILNFEYPEFYARELNIEINGIPTHLILSIDKISNDVRYQKFED